MGENIQRQTYIDIAKGIGIILVVFGHSFGAGLFAAKLYHMPLFFFLSGITFHGDHEFFGFLKRRVQRLYIPFLIYEFAYLLLSPFFCWLGIISTCPRNFEEVVNLALHIVLFDNVSILLSPLWFVTALFFSQLLMFGIERLIILIGKDTRQRQTLRILCGAVLLYIGLWIGNQRLFLIPWSLNFDAEVGVFLEAAAYELFGIFSGVWVRRREKGNDIRQMGQLTQGGWALGITLLLLFVGMIVYERIVKPVADMRSNNYDFWTMAPVFALIGISCMMSFSRSIIKKSLISKGLCYLGRHSFAIMCLHPLMFKLVGLVQVYAFGYNKEKLYDWQIVSSNPAWLGITALAGLLIPMLLIWGSDRIKYKQIQDCYHKITNRMRNSS